jgi:hypothetical protein
VPQSIPSGLTRDYVLRAIADLDAGAAHPFGPPTGYELVHEGRRYAPKAVVGLACLYLIGKVLRPGDFSGGEAPSQANHVLRQLGFTVVRKGEHVEDWSEREVALIVADYFEMLRKELFGQPFNKSEHRRALRPQLAARSESSIELKHANISAVLLKRGLPYIDGYKPRGHLQGLLADAVDSFLDQNPGYLQQLAESPGANPDKVVEVPAAGIGCIFVDPPDHIVVPDPGRPWLSLKARRIDFAERDAANRRLAHLSEGFVVELERRRLLLARRDDLARRVRWVSQDIGDGLGFDILSFDELDDAERYVEVKATPYGLEFPFYVTANEVRCSEDVPGKYRLYRVFDFRRAPRVYVLSGSLRDRCQLTPVQFVAAI